MAGEIENAAPAREERLKAGIAFCGTCAQLKNTLNQEGGGCLHAANRSFSQTYGCQFTLSLGILNTIRNAVIIMHGPIGCGFCSTANIGMGKAYKQLRDPSANGLIWLSSNLDETDVISGGEEKLKETILYADQEFRPETIIVASSCVPALIGDDVDSILQELQTEVTAELVPVICEGFKTKLMATAYDAVYNGILKKLTRYPERETYLTETDLEKQAREYKLKRTVNVFNVGSMSRADELEIQRLLTALELNVNFLPCYAAPEDFSYALEVALNVSICGTHDDYYLQYIYENFHIPYMIDTIPIGRKNTDRWLLKIAAHFGIEKEAQSLIRKENELLDDSLVPFRENLRGKRVLISGGEVRILATAEVVQDLEMKLVGLKGHHIDQFAKPIFEALDDIDDVHINIATQHPFEQANLVRRLNPDVMIIHTGSGNVTAKYGLPVFPLYGSSYNYIGYSGTYEIARRLNRIMKNSQFNKNLKKYRALPYKQEWYEKEPFTYIKY
ncbi:nitrogenase component 1 [Anaerosinus massiliensis]|uniref:nitrogenase component 1 n=1 Tax=Massilibacillus massiliensis TaxID=1806837 RepID=UPI000AEECF3F|nr:nitrogenase component 1 [Massilibacillus massiliensis]